MLRSRAMFDRMSEDVRVVFERDPAARSLAEVLLCYPGVHALIAHRAAHWLWARDRKLLGRLVSHAARFVTGIDIHPGATIGRRCFIDHGMGVVIGETTTIGDDVTLYQGATLGGVSTSHGKRHPDIGDRVVIGAGAKVLGPVQVGGDSKIGANSVVIHDVPLQSTLVGVPARVARKGEGTAGYDLAHDRLPDPVAAQMDEIARRVRALEQRLAEASEENVAVASQPKRLSRP